MAGIDVVQTVDRRLLEDVASLVTWVLCGRNRKCLASLLTCNTWPTNLHSFPLIGSNLHSLAAIVSI